MKPNRNPVMLAALLSISLRGHTGIGNPPPDPPRYLGTGKECCDAFAIRVRAHQASTSVRSCISMVRLEILRTCFGHAMVAPGRPTAEIVRECAGGRCVRLIRRAESSGVLEITEENSEGRRSERRLVLERR